MIVQAQTPTGRSVAAVSNGRRACTEEIHRGLCQAGAAGDWKNDKKQQSTKKTSRKFRAESRTGGAGAQFIRDTLKQSAES
jgi:hypothetical protein